MNDHAIKSKGIFIPSVVVQDKTLTIKDRFVLAVLLYLKQRGVQKYVWPTNEYLSDICSLTMSDIEDSLRNLIDLEYINFEVDEKYNNRIIYVHYGV